ncbi:MAG: lipocalin family protein [Gammaproteobacteria bacterium]|nr:lipocalin family protein [Gammaproteobacteria bacterium]
MTKLARTNGIIAQLPMRSIDLASALVWSAAASQGFIKSIESNAERSTRFVWLFKTQTLIVYLIADYIATIFGCSKRDYVWIMGRSPEIAASDYVSILSFSEERGYDAELIRRVRQRLN